MELIRLTDIVFAYPGRPPVLDGLDFQLAPGDRIGILGPNGAGKSTLFQIIMGLLQPQAGQVIALGQVCTQEKDFRALRAAVGYLFQDPDDQLFCPTVAEDVAFGPQNLGRDRHEALRIVDETLESIGLAGYQSRLTYQLSGGEKRLAALASVLAMKPKALLLDEPGNGLDQEHAARLEELLAGSDLSWAMVSHDQALLERTCRTMLYMDHGKLHPA